MLVAPACSFSAQLECQTIVRWTRTGLRRARAEVKRLCRSLSLEEDQMMAIHQDLSENLTVVSIIRNYGISGTTIGGNIEMTEVEIQ